MYYIEHDCFRHGTNTVMTHPASKSSLSERCTRTELLKHKTAEPERTSGDSIVQLHTLKPASVRPTTKVFVHFLQKLQWRQLYSIPIQPILAFYIIKWWQ